MPVKKDAIFKAISEVKQRSKKRNFRQSVEFILNLRDIDLKKPENRINELVELPHPPVEDIRITVFATGDLALRARDAGVYRVLDRDALIALANDKKSSKRLAKETNFFLAETTLMALIGKSLGPILGPRGKMPTPIPPTAPIETIIGRYQRLVRLRIRDQLVMQCRVGTEDMATDLLIDNIQAILTRFEQKLPKGLKNIRRAYVKTSMGSSSKIEL
jgi:large subunit ribosomal protein L1